MSELAKNAEKKQRSRYLFVSALVAVDWSVQFKGFERAPYIIPGDLYEHTSMLVIPSS